MNIQEKLHESLTQSKISRDRASQQMKSSQNMPGASILAMDMDATFIAKPRKKKNFEIEEEREREQ